MSKKRILSKIYKEFDYQEYVEIHHSVKYTNTDELRICCPRCGDHKYKCYVNTFKRVFNCFKCDFSSKSCDVFDFVATTEGITRAQAQLRLAHEFQETTPENLEEAYENSKGAKNSPSKSFSIKTIDALPLDAKPLTEASRGSYAPFWDYLLARGLTEEEIAAIGIHCVPAMTSSVYDSKDKYRGNIGRRVLWPVYGGDHKLVSWISRATRDADVPKYFNCPEAEQSKTLWPYVSPRDTTVVIVEGTFDALAVRRAGFSAYATLGKKISKEQIQLLKDWGVTSVILFWDKSDAKRDMVKASEELKLSFDTIQVPDWSNWPSSVDPGDCLRLEDGSSLIAKTLGNLIDVNSLDFVKWQITS